MSFAELGLAPELLRAVAQRGLHRAHARPARSDPARPRRSRRARRRPDGHGQDGRLRAAHPPAPDSESGLTPDAAAVGRSASDRHAHARACLQVEESVRTYGRERPVRSTADLRRRALRPQVRKLPRRRRSSSPRPAGCSTTSRSAPSTWPGSRCWCSTRPTACWTWASSPTSARSSTCSPRSART